MPATNISESQDAGLYASRGAIIEAMPKIIEAIIQKAAEGSHQHAKFLVEFAGGFDKPAAAGGEEESLAAMLLRELRAGEVEPEAA